MITFKTEKGNVYVEFDKSNKPIFKLPQGMHGEIWMTERTRILKLLKNYNPKPKSRKRA